MKTVRIHIYIYREREGNLKKTMDARITYILFSIGNEEPLIA